MTIKKLGPDFDGFDYSKDKNLQIHTTGTINFVRADNISSSNVSQSTPTYSSSSEEDKIGINVDGYNNSSNSNIGDAAAKNTSEMPDSIPIPPENGVSKKSLDGATSYKKEYIEGSEEIKYPLFKDANGKYLQTEPMYRETIEYDDGTVITNIYEGDKLVKSIEDKYSGDPKNPKHGDTRDTKTIFYKDDGSIDVIVENNNDQKYIEDIGWTDGLLPDKYTFYDEDGNPVEEFKKDEETGKISENSEWKDKKRKFSIAFPGYNSQYQEEKRRRQYNRDDQYN